jgi:hypothetical protein
MIVSILVLVPVLLTVTISSALASSLLSGYGGPGQGSQAILGSALLNGPRGGGGSGTGTVGAPGSSVSSSIASTSVGAPAGGARVASPRSQARVHSGYRKQAAGAAGQASGGPSNPYLVAERSGTGQRADAASETLGLSGADLLYVLLALCVLALTAVLTKRLTRESTSSYRDAIQDPSN